MSCWRVLQLSDGTDDDRVPQLLCKPQFQDEAYSIFLTDLSNIWGEDLQVSEIVERASQQESPIEVSTEDTSQLAILLQNVRNSLSTSDGTACHITRGDGGGVTLHTSISLPEPLGSLTWRFDLGMRTPGTLKNELILPLLVSSHIQHARISSLITSIQNKDKAIKRLLDQFESSNLDLASAFPSIGGSKPGRRFVKREQAARHIPALHPFDEETWKRDTCQLEDGHISTLGLFEEALSECTPKVPSHMKSGQEQNSWWTLLKASVGKPKLPLNPRQKKVEPPIQQPSEHTDDETETEDEFETHENFKLRQRRRNPTEALQKTVGMDADADFAVGSADEESEEDDDLDAPPKSQDRGESQTQTRTPTKIQPKSSNSPGAASPPSPQAVAFTQHRPRGFRIGGAKHKKASESPPPSAPVPTILNVEATPSTSSPENAQVGQETATPRTKRTFKIGGKNKTQEGLDASPSSKSEKQKVPIKAGTMHALVAGGTGRSTIIGVDTLDQEQEHEETSEEKAERKRRELKRKNEELAKKQAQKKKKRF